MEFDTEKIKKFLHQRYPFLFIDKIIEFEKGKSVVGMKNVTVNEPFFQGHFPDRKIMPGVLVTEAMAQTAAMLFYDETESKNPIYYLGSIKARFLKPVVPGDIMKIRAVPLKIIKDAGIVEAEVSVDGEVVAKAKLSFKEAL